MERDAQQLDRIAKLVGKTLSGEFGNIRIVSVNVRSSIDFDDEEVLNIDIVFEGTPKDLDARKISGAVRHVRPVLSEIGETAFPILSFISQADMGSAQLASA